MRVLVFLYPTAAKGRGILKSVLKGGGKGGRLALGEERQDDVTKGKGEHRGQRRLPFRVGVTTLERWGGLSETGRGRECTVPASYT